MYVKVIKPATIEDYIAAAWIKAGLAQEVTGPAQADNPSAKPSNNKRRSRKISASDSKPDDNPGLGN